MDPDPGSSKSKRWSFWKGKGSVQRARQMLETGQRPEPAPAPPPAPTPEPGNDQDPASPSRRIQWPLLNSRDLNFLENQSGRSPRGPAPPRPPRPDASSPSVGLGITPDLHHVRPPARRSFSQPIPPNRDSSSSATQSSESGVAPNIAVTNEEQSRWSSVSDSTSTPSSSDSPVSGLPKKTAGLAPPQPPPLSKAARHFGRRSSISPIPEELSGESQPSSGALPTDSTSTGRESDIHGSYIDDDSLDWQEARTSHRDDGEEGLVRQASLGKRGKPSLRVIHKPSKTSLAASEGRPSTSEENTIGRSMPKAIVGEAPSERTDTLKVPSPKGSYSSLSDRSYEFDLEKGDFILDIGHDSSQGPPQGWGGGGDGAASNLPRATGPTMSDTRPDARRPPKLDMDAVRDAEARGSLTSLPDLIRRATRLASNLDHGRTASRTNNHSSDRLAPWDRQRNSAHLHDTLASFPPPPHQDRSSWPAFFRRSTLHNVETLNSDSDHGQAEKNGCSQRCCGMPLWLFITLAVALVIIITLAVLLPIFLIVVPQQRSACENSTPCDNGGVSVSSGSTCSCICTNGYSGARCSIPGNEDCTTVPISGSSSAKSATMGNSLPQLFKDSQQQFNIPLDESTSMALFSKSNVPCQAQNKLVSFKDLSSSDKSRRALDNDYSSDISNVFDIEPAAEQEPATSGTIVTLNIRDSTATNNGIIYDNSSPSETTPIDTGSTATPQQTPCADAAPAPAPTTEPATTDAPSTKTPDSDPTTTEPTSTNPTTTSSSSSSSSSPTSASTSTSTPSNIPPKTLAFARTAVLYIFQSTGAFTATLESQQKIASHLASGGGGKSGLYGVDLSRAGVNTKFSLDFKGFKIRSENGEVVGGS